MILNFRGYDVGVREIYIVAKHITHWIPIYSNGLNGTEITLSTGESLRVQARPSDVEKAYRQALTEETPV